jgi:hypothetical protein
MTTTAMTMTMTQAVTLQHLKLYSILIGVVAIVFWIWAIINTIQNDQIIDGGIISFLTVIISSIYIIYLTIKIGNNNSNVDDHDNDNVTTTTPQNQNQRRRRRLLQSVCTARWIVGSHLFVTLNYFVGIIVSWKGKRIYSIIFTILWMISSYFIWYLMKQYRLSASNATSSSSLDDDADDADDADADDNNNNNNNNSNNDNDNDNNNDEVA